MSNIDSYWKACIDGLPAEKRELAMQAYYDVFEGEPGAFAKVLILFDAQSRYLENFLQKASLDPESVQKIIEKSLNDPKVLIKIGEIKSSIDSSVDVTAQLVKEQQQVMDASRIEIPKEETKFPLGLFIVGTLCAANIILTILSNFRNSEF